MADRDPALLISTLERRGLPTWELSFTAEAAGILPAARGVLLALLEHASPTVREGAIYGLSKQVDAEPALRARLSTIARSDRSGAVREAAAEALTS